MSATRYRLILESALIELERVGAEGDGRAVRKARGLREELRQIEQDPLPTVLDGQMEIAEVL